MGNTKRTKYLTPEELWLHFEAYIVDAKNNPIYKIEYVGKDGRAEETPLAVPITFEGFERYLADKEVLQDLCDYSCNRDNSYNDHVPVVKRIRNYCFVNNFNGAAVGVFKENLIGKKLGLIERINQNVTNTPILNIDPLDDSANNSTKKDSESS